MSGNIAISLAPIWGWSWTLVAQAAIYLALLPVTVFAPEPAGNITRPQTLKEAIWLPFVGFLSRPRALEITAFVLLYRLADSIAGALVSPFLLKQGFSAFDVGVVRGAVGIWGTIVGTLLGGAMATRWGLGRALWICGVLQILSNSGYAVVAVIAPTTGMVAIPYVGTVNLILQFAIFLETMTGGMGWGAFGVLLLRLTDKRFSATQYAFFSSLVGLARTFVGPPAGVMADALGWRDFFLLTMVFGIPGMLMLKRFVPWGQEPKEVSGEEVEPLPQGAPWAASQLWGWGGAAAAGFTALSLLASGLMATIKSWRAAPIDTRTFDFLAGMKVVTLPQTWTEGVDLASALIFGLMAGLAVAAGMAARGRPSSPSPLGRG
jgi:PAT family beta-lactamase induction signal transducer AmpG